MIQQFEIMKSVFEETEKPIYSLLAHYIRAHELLGNEATLNKINTVIEEAFPKSDNKIGIDDEKTTVFTHVSFVTDFNKEKSAMNKLVFNCKAIVSAKNEKLKLATIEANYKVIPFRLIVKPSLIAIIDVKVIGKFGSKLQFLKDNIEDLYNSILLKKRKF